MKYNKFTLFCIIFVALVPFNNYAQDIHFSQFWDAPLLQSPTSAGRADGAVRAIVNYRTQWASVSSNPFSTFGANVDMRLHTSHKGSHLAGGISMYTDLAGSAKMRTTLVNLSAVYHLNFSDNNYFSLGLQGGFHQKGLDVSQLRFDNQFDGIGHNPTINSNENLSNFSVIRPTLSAGISYTWSNSFSGVRRLFTQNKKSVNIGFTVHHFNSPKFNILHQENLGLKYIGHVETAFETHTDWLISPKVLVAIQNKATDIILGSLFTYPLSHGSRMNNYSNSASIGFGAFYRLKDALIPTLQVQWSSISLGLSYDVNLSSLNDASRYRGGFEISLKYISNNPRLKGSSMRF